MTAQHMHLSRRAFVGGAAAFGIASLAVPHSAFADPTSADVQAQADAARVKLDDMQARLSEASDNYHVALEEHDAAVKAMDKAQARIDKNNKEIASYQERLGDRARTMYRDGQTTFLDIVLGSSTFEDFTRNWDALQSMNSNDAELVSTTKALRADNEKQKAEYEAQAMVAKEKMEEAEVIKNEAEQLVAEYQAEVDSLDAEVAELVEAERRAAAAAAAAAEAERVDEEAEQRRQQNQQNQEEEADRPAADNDDDDDYQAPSQPSQPSKPSQPSQPSQPSGGNGTPNGAALGVAQGFLGVPYVWGGSTPSGFDCSGLTSYCYAATGYSIGRTTGAQYASARYILSLGQAQPGDVLYTGGHVGICASSGGGSYIHAPAPGQVVSYSSWPQFYCALRW